MSTTLSADYDSANSNAGPYWALNSTWNVGNLVNGTDYTQSLTMQNASTPNVGTTISWNFPNTPAGYNVYSYPAVFYGTYAGFNSPANNVTAEQINNIKTLTLSHNISLSGQTDQYDAMYDGYLTSTPDGGQSSIQHEIEVYAHTPGYVQDWVSNLPQHSFTDAQGMKWTIATQGNIVIFVPSNFQDLTNHTIDLKALLQAAAADGVISGSEYFDGIALGNEPREGSGSMTINSMTVNYDGDHTASASTGTTTPVSTGDTTGTSGTSTGTTGTGTTGTGTVSTGGTTDTTGTTHTGGTTGSTGTTGTTGTTDGTGTTDSTGTTHAGGTTDSTGTTGSTGATGSTTGTETVPALTVSNHSLSVSPGHSIDLGVSVSLPTTGDDVTVNITGLPKYETITDNLDHKVFSGSNITLTAAEVNSGLTLTSNYHGHGHPTATLTVTATDHTANTSSAAQSIVVTDPPTTSGTTGAGSTTHHTGGWHHSSHHTGGTAITGSTTATGDTTGTGGTAHTCGTAPASGTQASNPATTTGQDTSSNTHQDAGAHLGHDAAIHDLMAFIQHQVQTLEHMWH